MPAFFLFDELDDLADDPLDLDLFRELLDLLSV